MIITEIEGGLRHTYSNLGVLIHGGHPEADYAEAYDPVDTDRTYKETEIAITDNSTAEELLQILMGGEV